VAAKLLDGKGLAKTIREEIRADVEALEKTTGTVPKLTAILLGDDPASQVYVRNKERACEKAGIDSELVRLPGDTSLCDLLAQIERLNVDPSVHGILVQLPLPPHISEQDVLDAVSADKDVDAFHAENAGLLMQGRPRFLPCTPHGIQLLLHRNQIPVVGKHVVIVGRSNIVGKPMASLLIQRDCYLGPTATNATVTVCHSRTADLPAITRQAEILIVAIGRPKFVTADMVAAGAVVVDVGSNRIADGFVGDVDFERVREVASYITPVPGGVGPLTVTMLLRNTLTAAQAQSADDSETQTNHTDHG
jgi:methylenetetrahydrofolate dehydrogenase (NADP+)/methenyltetrahydrofolate cyclohydrolase